MKMKTFAQAKADAVEIFNLEDVKDLDWSVTGMTDYWCSIICNDKDFTKIVKCILKGDNLLLGVKHPTTEDLVIISEFSINICKKCPKGE